MLPINPAMGPLDKWSDSYQIMSSQSILIMKKGVTLIRHALGKGSLIYLLLQHCHHILAVHAGDIPERNFFWTFCFTASGGRTITEALCVHFFHHVQYTISALRLSLR